MLTDPIKGFGPRLGQIAFGALFREPKQVVELDRDGDKIDIGDTVVTVDHTPGHTRGSVVFRVGERRHEERSSRARLHRGHAVPAVGRPHRPARRQRPRPAGVDRDKTDGARRRHRGTTGARRKVHHRLRTPHQPVPRRFDPVILLLLTSAAPSSRRPRGCPTTCRRSRRSSSRCATVCWTAARRAGYADIELPIFEDTALFARGVGESTDVVSKEMYTFADRGDRSVTLRPEGTAGVMRAVDRARPRPRPAAGQALLRGPVLPLRASRRPAATGSCSRSASRRSVSTTPTLDAEVIAVADAGFRSLGLDGFRLEITSLGDDSCRPQYRELLQEFLFKLDLDEDTRRRAEINPLRVLDDKRPQVQGDDGRRAGDARPPLRFRQAALRHRAGAPRRARRAVRDQPADGARAGLLHEDDVRVRPRRPRCAVRHRRRRPLRRADAPARRTGPVRASGSGSASTARCWR